MFEKSRPQLLSKNWHQSCEKNVSSILLEMCPPSPVRNATLVTGKKLGRKISWENKSENRMRTLMKWHKVLTSSSQRSPYVSIKRHVSAASCGSATSGLSLHPAPTPSTQSFLSRSPFSSQRCLRRVAILLKLPPLTSHAAPGGEESGSDVSLTKRTTGQSVETRRM